MCQLAAKCLQQDSKCLGPSIQGSVVLLLSKQHCKTNIRQFVVKYALAATLARKAKQYTYLALLTFHFLTVAIGMWTQLHLL